MINNEHHLILSDPVKWLKVYKRLKRKGEIILTTSVYNDPCKALQTIKNNFKTMTWYIKGNISIPQQPLRKNLQYIKAHQLMTPPQFILKKQLINYPRLKQVLINLLLHPFDQLVNRFIIKDNRIDYVRYGTEFVIGVQGSKQKAKQLFESIQTFIKQMFTSVSHILSFAHFEKSFQFYRYTIRMIKRRNKHIRLEIPRWELERFATLKQYGLLRTFTSTHRTKILHYSELDMMRIYNQELLAFAKYYRLADNFSDLGKLFYLAESSFLKTVANKRRSTVKKVGSRLRKHNQGVLSLKYYQPNGKRKYLTFIRLKDVRHLNISKA